MTNIPIIGTCAKIKRIPVVNNTKSLDDINDGIRNPTVNTQVNAAIQHLK